MSYWIDSLDWDGFRRLVEAPGRAQLAAFAERVAEVRDDMRETYEDPFGDGDPIGDWPEEPDELAPVLRERLARVDWYGDLSDLGKDLWEVSFTALCREEQAAGVDFRDEARDVGWEVIELARRLLGIPRDRATDAVLSRFAAGPYRYHPPLTPDDWDPGHSMHPPEEVHRLVEELDRVAPALAAEAGERARFEFEQILRPAVERVARAGRLLFVTADT